MADLSKTQQFIVGSLGTRRQQLIAQIEAMQNGPSLAELQAELTEVEMQMKGIDPSIPLVDAAAVEAVNFSVKD